MISQLEHSQQWDIVIIGGGATGLGAAVDSASRGYKTLLVEMHDFAKGTSSRSTKLVHGGVRYLAQGNIRLVTDALKERGRLLKNAPHVCSDLSFIIPAYKWWEKFYYGMGLRLYDLMASKLSLGNTKILSAAKTNERLSSVNTNKLRGGILYHDGQFDDTRLAINLAQTAVELGATAINYCMATSFLKEKEKIAGVVLKDVFTNKEYKIDAKAVINATGVFTDQILKMDDPLQPEMVSASQGIHLVIDKKFFPGNDALMVPKTSDGRVLFAVPWHGKVVVGTTDTPVANVSFEPRALEEEIEFVIANLNIYLAKKITRKDLLSVFAGLRPLVKNVHKKKTSLLPRDHSIVISKSGLVTITGGKWTTYRKMAEDVINKTAANSNLPKKNCITTDLKIHGFTNEVNTDDPMHFYGSDAAAITSLTEKNPAWKELIHRSLPYQKVCVIWAVRKEMAMTVEDVLARRTRALFLDANAATASAKTVATLMADELQQDEQWITDQTEKFTKLAKGYVL